MRLLTRSDFDGTCCAVLLKEVGLVDEMFTQKLRNQRGVRVRSNVMRRQRQKRIYLVYILPMSCVMSTVGY